MTIWSFPDHLILELDQPEVELVIHLESGQAAWLDSQTGRVLAWLPVARV